MQFASRLVAPVSGAVTVLMPKCPICSLALLQVLGIHTAFSAGLVRPVFLAFAGIPVLFLAIQAFRRQTWMPFGMYLLGAGLLVLDRLYWQVTYPSAGGVLLFAGSAIWTTRCHALNASCNAEYSRKKGVQPCP